MVAYNAQGRVVITDATVIINSVKDNLVSESPPLPVGRGGGCLWTFAIIVM